MGDAATDVSVEADVGDSEVEARPDASVPDALDEALEDSAGDDQQSADAPDAPGDAETSVDGATSDGSGQDADSSVDEADAQWEAEAEAPPVETLVRVMAANTTSGNCQCYDQGPGIRIFQGLAPDVVLIQEFKYGANTPEDLRAFVDTAFGTGFSYYREPGSKQIPNGVISRWPIVEAGTWDDPDLWDRDFVWARLDTPAATDLWAVSVHLRTSSALDRKAEAENLIAYIDAAIPSGAAVVLGGDFNTGSRAEGCLTVLSNRFVTTGPYPVDESGNGNTNSNRNAPYDWVIGSPALEGFSVPLQVGSLAFPDGLVFDSREYSLLDEVQPVLATDSDAPSMQHMAVMRAFLLP